MYHSLLWNQSNTLPVHSEFQHEAVDAHIYIPRQSVNIYFEQTHDKPQALAILSPYSHLVQEWLD